MQAKTLHRWILAVVALAVAALILPPFINMGRYKARITASISSALGRPVTVDSVELRLLPQPGFYMENLSVGDDPAYSSEPILHAEEVRAYLRLSSLWRGRLEIARLNLNYPSLNLVERADESWNLESLLWKASRTESAPTGAPASRKRIRFPYIEANNGRINFKYGLEKSVFSFTEADFTLFSPAENQWHMRLAARPVRTDLPVTDTGTVKAEVTIQRASMLRDAPMKATLSWERVQLGNLTRLIYGEDRGWRGELDVSTVLEGTPGALHVTSAARLRELRRYDISTGNATNLSATCSGELTVSENAVRSAECLLPLEGGLLSVRGALRGIRQPRYDLTISGESIPAGAVLNTIRHSRPDLPADLSATGTVTATFHGQRQSDAPPEWIGDLSVNGLVLHSAVLGKDLAIGRISAQADTLHPRAARHGRYVLPTLPPVRALVVQSFDLPLGAASPAIVDGQLDDEGFAVHLKGDGRLERLQQFSQTAGIGAPRIALSGLAAMDLMIGAKWSDFASPGVNGTLQVKSVRAEIPGLAAPLEIAAARVELDQHRFTLHRATATAGTVTVSGSASFPRSCNADSPCESTLDLATDELNLERWNELLNPHLKKKKSWYTRFGEESGTKNVMANLHATGHFTARRFTLETSTGSALQTDFSIANGVLQLKNTRAELFGGNLSSDWTLDFTGAEPKIESSGSATRVQSEKLASLLKGSLGSGALELKYKLTMTGTGAEALGHSAQAETDFTWNGGALKISPDGKASMRVISGDGHAKLDQAGWTILASKWTTPGGIYQLTGTASRDSAIALVFTEPGGAVWKVGGTLLKPTATASTPEPTQARRR